MQEAYSDELDEIAKLSNEDILLRAVPILARLRGHLSHEQRLMELAVVENKNPLDLPPETYAEPTEEGPVDTETTTTAPYVGPFAEFQQNQSGVIVRNDEPVVKPKKRRKRRKHRTKKE